MQQKMIQFSGDVSLPAVGQGTWYMGEDASQRKTEVAALRAGIELGLTLIDTAEMYADGGAEKVVGEALTGLREKVFLVSKVYPWNAGGQKAINACEASLRRLNTDYLDLYLLHWSGSFAFEETVAAMEKLIAQGKIRRWGVSNLDYADMQELWQLPGGNQCATNQVLYQINVSQREWIAPDVQVSLWSLFAFLKRKPFLHKQMFCSHHPAYRPC